MNLAKFILDLLFSGNVLERLSSYLDTDEQTTKKAASAAVPAILSSLVGLAANDEGARKLSSTLSGLDATLLSGLTKMLTGDTGAVAQKGGNLLASLLGDNL